MIDLVTESLKSQSQVDSDFIGNVAYNIPVLTQVVLG